MAHFKLPQGSITSVIWRFFGGDVHVLPLCHIFHGDFQKFRVRMGLLNAASGKIQTTVPILSRIAYRKEKCLHHLFAITTE